ncbi:UNVERIFIED_CONTAM: hypothetical protein FKN15_022800 [Acipenser sinensis]
MDRNALAELLQALESRRDAEERRREERYTALIERAARKSTPIIVQGQKLSFRVDYSAITATKRRAFGEVRAKLRSQGVDNFLVYPAILKVNHRGEWLSFTTPEEVDSFFAQHFQDTMCFTDPSARRTLCFSSLGPD